MQYLLLIYINEAEERSMSPEAMTQQMKEFAVFTQSIAESGQRLGGHRLRPVAEAVTVRVRGGRTLRTGGPFAETHEQLGGYYLIEAADVEEAAAIAARIPAVRHGSIEVRPIWPLY